jgi:predicted alpha/beta-hydrolase family hydrolase
MPTPYVDSTIKEKITLLAHQLYEALESGDREQILAAQAALSEAVESLWLRIDQSDATPKDKAISRLLTDMAVKGLPNIVQDEKNYPEIKQKLRLLKSSLVLLE